MPAFYLNNVFGYLPCIFFLVVSIFSLLYVFALRRTFSFSQPANNMYCRKNTKHKFSVVMKNKWLLFYPRITCRFYKNNLFGQIAEVTDLDTTLCSKEKKNFDFDIEFNHIGTYEMGISSIRVYDLFGIFYLTCKNFDRGSVIVRPRCFDVKNLDFYDVRGRQITLSTARSKMEGDDYSGVRQYTRGDPIKSIHWKISAHTREYMVRVFESYTNRGVTIYVDSEVTGYPDEDLLSIYDCLVETAYSIANCAVEQKEDVELIYKKDNYVQTMFPRNQDDIDNEIMDLNGVSPSYGGQLVEMFEANSYRQYGMDIIIVCTANLNESLIQYLEQMRGLRKKIYLFYAVTKTRKQNLSDDEKLNLGNLLNLGINYYVNYSAEELQHDEEMKEYA